MRFKLWLENVDLMLSTANEDGIKFETGKPVTFKYMRGNEKAQNFGSLYQQDIEPAGRYLIHNENPGDVGNRWEVGQVSFQNPLVIKYSATDDVSYDEHNWKYRLYQYYGKKGKALSQAIRRDGYDAIVTTGMGNYTKEIVDLTMF